MSITQTYYLAHKARGKLSSEAARPDHNLRLLVGHANLLDSLMLDLAEAEREQESWFNQSVRGASSDNKRQQKQQEHIQWADTVVEEPEEDWEPEDASSTDSDSSDSYSSDSSDDEYDDEGDVEMADAVSLRRVASHSNTYTYNKPQSIVEDMELNHHEHEEAVEFEDDLEEDYAQLTLVRTTSHSHSPPPELDEDEESEDDESIMPPSPPTLTVHQFTEKEREAIVTTGFYQSKEQQQQSQSQQPATPSSKDDFYEQGYYLPRRNPARLVSAISVY
ncbi:hypothetical protein MKZ38_000559 [Zalerion maritima]|uniref:Protein ECM13 n=1 Tax=Zalerion maritima TaxID=339359 RepID=A0AAD5WN26_9PEZI|nr:hypothetical protein MKZ38_000559 [Zalerion maritima]